MNMFPKKAKKKETTPRPLVLDEVREELGIQKESTSDIESILGVLLSLDKYTGLTPRPALADVCENFGIEQYTESGEPVPTSEIFDTLVSLVKLDGEPEEVVQPDETPRKEERIEEIANELGFEDVKGTNDLYDALLDSVRGGYPRTPRPRNLDEICEILEIEPNRSTIEIYEDLIQISKLQYASKDVPLPVHHTPRPVCQQGIDKKQLHQVGVTTQDKSTANMFNQLCNIIHKAYDPVGYASSGNENKKMLRAMTQVLAKHKRDSEKKKVDRKRDERPEDRPWRTNMKKPGAPPKPIMTDEEIIQRLREAEQKGEEGRKAALARIKNASPTKVASPSKAHQSFESAGLSPIRGSHEEDSVNLEEMSAEEVASFVEQEKKKSKRQNRILKIRLSTKRQKPFRLIKLDTSHEQPKILKLPPERHDIEALMSPRTFKPDQSIYQIMRELMRQDEVDVTPEPKKEVEEHMPSLDITMLNRNVRRRAFADFCATQIQRIFRGFVIRKLKLIERFRKRAHHIGLKGSFTLFGSTSVRMSSDISQLKKRKLKKHSHNQFRVPVGIRVQYEKKAAKSRLFLDANGLNEMMKKQNPINMRTMYSKEFRDQTFSFPRYHKAFYRNSDSKELKGVHPGDRGPADSAHRWEKETDEESDLQDYLNRIS